MHTFAYNHPNLTIICYKLTLIYIGKVAMNMIGVTVPCVNDSSVDKTSSFGAVGRGFDSRWRQKVFRWVEHVPHKIYVVISDTSTCVTWTQTCLSYMTKNVFWWTQTNVWSAQVFLKHRLDFRLPSHLSRHRVVPACSCYGWIVSLIESKNLDIETWNALVIFTLLIKP